MEKVDFAFIEAAETVGTEGLHDTDIDVGVEIMLECFAIDGDEFFEGSKIVKVELLAKLRGEIGFGVVKKRGEVVLQGAFAATLVVDEIGLAVTEEDVARLEIAVEKIITRGAKQEIGEPAEIVFEGVLVERNAGETQKVIFEIVEVPSDGLAIEASDGIADAVIEIAAGFDLKAWQDGYDFAIGFDNLGRDSGALAVFREQFEERGVAEVFFEVRAVIESFGIDFRDGEAMTAEMFGEGQKGGVFFLDVVENADGGAGAST